MLLLWSSGLTVGAVVCFILIAVGIVPNRLNLPETGTVFSKSAAHAVPDTDTVANKADFQVIHEPADVILPDVSTSNELTAANDSDAWNQSDALDNIPAWDVQTVVSKPESPTNTLSADISSATGPAHSGPAPISSPSESAAIGPTPDWPPIPVEKNPSDIYLGAAEKPNSESNAPNTSETSNAGQSVSAHSTVPEVNDWNQLAAVGVSASKSDLDENAPMKNQISRFDSVTAKVAASEDFYRQAYRQGGSAPTETVIPAQPSNQRPNVAPNIAPTTAPEPNTAPVQAAPVGSNFAGYQIRSTQATTAMQTPTSSLR